MMTRVKTSNCALTIGQGTGIYALRWTPLGDPKLACLLHYFGVMWARFLGLTLILVCGARLHALEIVTHSPCETLLSQLKQNAENLHLVVERHRAEWSADIGDLIEEFAEESVEGQENVFLPELKMRIENRDQNALDAIARQLESSEREFLQRLLTLLPAQSLEIKIGEKPYDALKSLSPIFEVKVRHKGDDWKSMQLEVNHLYWPSAIPAMLVDRHDQFIHQKITSNDEIAIRIPSTDFRVTGSEIYLTLSPTKR
jgi:hypothetical protein